jgi:hypothetical protein
LLVVLLPLAQLLLAHSAKKLTFHLDLGRLTDMDWDLVTHQNMVTTAQNMGDIDNA